MESKITKEKWKKKLTKEQHLVLRDKGTERAFTGKYWNHHEKGIYKCAGCGAPLFSSEEKFDSESGWPSFGKPYDDANVDEKLDERFGMKRKEVICSNCGGHLGHVFDDGPNPNSCRYCINSISLDFQAETTDL